MGAGIEDDLSEGFNKALFSINQGNPWKIFTKLKLISQMKNY